MSTFPAFETAVLPGAAADLLASFPGRDGTRLRFWVRQEEEWVCVYPEGTEAAGSPAAGAALRTINVEGTVYGLEVVTGRADAPELDFLVSAVARVLAYEQEARSAARELTERYEEINLLYSISEILGSVMSLEAAASRIVAEVADVMGARRASLWVFAEPDRELYLAAAVGEDGLSGPVSVDDPRSVTARVFRERQALNLERGDDLPRGTRLEPQPHGGEAFLSVPINYTPPEGDGRTVGVITLVGGRNSQRFSAGDARLLTAIASQVGAALETHRLMQESLRQERVVHEMELAHDLQLKLLPSTAQFEGTAQVAARCAPADSVGGDFYQLFRLSDDRIGVMIGDVSGHGFSAALIMALAMSAVAISAQEAGPPGEVLRRVHRALAAELESAEMHISVFYGVLDPNAGRLVYANAGHPHAFAIAAGEPPVRLSATNPPLGMLPLDGYLDAVMPWRAGGDLLFLFTDGLAESVGPRSGGNGEARLVEEVVRLQAEPPATILERIFEIAERTRTPAIPADDRTAVLVRV